MNNQQYGGSLITQKHVQPALEKGENYSNVDQVIVLNIDEKLNDLVKIYQLAQFLNF